MSAPFSNPEATEATFAEELEMLADGALTVDEVNRRHERELERVRAELSAAYARSSAVADRARADGAAGERERIIAMLDRYSAAAIVAARGEVAVTDEQRVAASFLVKFIAEELRSEP